MRAGKIAEKEAEVVRGRLLRAIDRSPLQEKLPTMCAMVRGACEKMPLEGNEKRTIYGVMKFARDPKGSLKRIFDGMPAQVQEELCTFLIAPR